MHEQEHSKNSGQTVDPARPSGDETRRMADWMRRRKLRNLTIGLLLTGITTAGTCFHSVFAEPQISLISHLDESADVRSAASSTLGADNLVCTSPSSQERWRSLIIPANAATITQSRSLSHDSDIYQIDEKRQEPIPFNKVIHLSQSEPTGETRLRTSGSNGILEKTFGVTYRGAQPIKYVLKGQRVVKKPVDMELLAGYTDREARALPSRSGMYNRGREFDMVATGYSPYEGSGSGRCANGMRAGFGVVAVDPRVIPLGSRLYVSGYGYAFAGDTGGAIRGHRIDLGLNSYRAANDIGRRKVHVYVLADK